jgi:hypothetical protein
MCVIVQGELGVRNPVRLVRLPCGKIREDYCREAGILACNEFKCVNQ